jgi:hypothetical protein
VATVSLCGSDFQSPLDFFIYDSTSALIGSSLASASSCATFDVPVAADSTLYYGTVTGADGCSRNAALAPLHFANPSVTTLCIGGCNQDCGPYDASIQVCGSGFSGPSTFVLSDNNGNVLFTQTGVNADCYTFTAPVVADGTVFQGEVIGADGCTRGSALGQALTFVDPYATVECIDNCDFKCGAYNATIELCGYGFQGSMDFALWPSTAAVQTSADNCVTFVVLIDSTVLFRGTVTGSDGCGRSIAMAHELNFIPELHVTAGFAQDGCLSTGVITATATGGTEAYSYALSVNGLVADAWQSSNLLSYEGHLDGQCYAAVVNVVDVNGCSAASSALGISQCSTASVCDI